MVTESRREMRALFFVFPAFFLLCVSVSAQPSQTCFPRPQLEATLENNNETVIFLGIVSNQIVAELWAGTNKQGRPSWSFVTTNARNWSCMIVVGRDWTKIYPFPKTHGDFDG